MKRARFTEEQIIGVLREHEAGAKLAFVEAVHRAHVDAVDNFAANTALVDDEGQLSVLSADRSGELVHGVRLSSRC
jgi:putative transposase